MANLFLVRHAEPAALWGAHPDPGLSELGEAQALTVAGKLLRVATANLNTSPLARCRQTAVPSQAIRGQVASVNNAVAEIPVPVDVTDHRAWLTMTMSGKWSDDHVGPDLVAWRAGVARALLDLGEDTIIFSHFVAINAAVSVATSSDDVIIFKPGHASITILESRDGALHLVELGQESAIHLA